MVMIVCGLADIPAVIAERRPSHLITLLDPATMIETPEGFTPERHLRLGVNDIAAPMEGMTAPDEALVGQLMTFGDSWDASAPMLIHCWAGISRSTASAFAIACARNPQASEIAIARAMRSAAPHAYPNRRIVALADDWLGRQGRMVDAVEAIGGSGYVSLGTPFELAARHP